ncbi:protein LIFEGUARD 2-like [Hordeum vulgare subsp. vulgare]|uniref:BI1-like protein n=1 Tax=Hordeum vulgare subsp. vulgare TaxID=112509 RepID=A0A287SLC8_HORVV|nr:protein LIFEGUARD 2-like [Hordeum vulgare subsp. vulgare]
MGKHDHHHYDVEACYPSGPDGYMIESPELRWAFIRKVYVIVSLQMLVTVAVAAAMNLTDSVRTFFLSRTPAALGAFIVILISPLLVMLPMVYFRKKHPVNLVFLGIFTVCISLSIGLGCLTKRGPIIFEAAGMTLVVVVSLTAYTFWAAKRGHDFEFLGPFLFAACVILLLYAIVIVLFPMGKTTVLVYGCIAALIFSAFIIYDTDNLIKRYTYDEYVAASITLYLDIINLFRAILIALEAAD